jgi:hypothetical protein
MSAHLSRLHHFQRHLRILVWVWVWVWDWIHWHTSPRTRSPSSRHPPFTLYPFSPRSLVCGGQTSPHKPRLVLSHSTCSPLSSSPHALLLPPRAQICIRYCSSQQQQQQSIFPSSNNLWPLLAAKRRRAQPCPNDLACPSGYRVRQSRGCHLFSRRRTSRTLGSTCAFTSRTTRVDVTSPTTPSQRSLRHIRPTPGLLPSWSPLPALLNRSGCRATTSRIQPPGMPPLSAS